MSSHREAKRRYRQKLKLTYGCNHKKAPRIRKEETVKRQLVELPT